MYNYVNRFSIFFKQDPNEDTEWNEILRDFGILPPKEEPKDEIEEMVLRLQKEAMGTVMHLVGWIEMMIVKVYFINLEGERTLEIPPILLKLGC